MKLPFLKIALAICIIVTILSILMADSNNSMRISAEKDLAREMGKLKSRDAVIDSHFFVISEQNNIIREYERTIKKLNFTIRSSEVYTKLLEDDLVELENKLEVMTSSLGQSMEELERRTGELIETEEELNKTVYYLRYTEEELKETQRLLDIAKFYEERVKQGIDTSLAYKLLGDYDKVVDVVATFTDVYPIRTDSELWLRSKDVYDWLGNHYSYCSDKGLCLGEYCVQLQYFSPNELLHGLQGGLCGDCDDYAQLFVGMLYASGVPHDKARVECGLVPAGGHCWAGVYVNNGWYRIDPVCANPVEYLNFFGLKIQLQYKMFSESFEDVGCFSTYQLLSWYDAEGYHKV